MLAGGRYGVLEKYDSGIVGGGTGTGGVFLLRVLVSQS